MEQVKKDNLNEFGEESCKALRKYPVLTELPVLFRLRQLFKELKLGGLLKGEELSNKDMVMALLEVLNDNDKINEFCRIVTGVNEFDYKQEKPGTVLWVINDFFVSWWWQIPPSWRKWITEKINLLMQIGIARATMPVKSIQTT